MSQFDKLAKKLQDPAFAKAYSRNKIRAVEAAIGRELKPHEQEGIRVLSHKKLTTVVHALRPRGKGPHEPE